jgi:uncharacterized protein (DUF58 family)
LGLVEFPTDGSLKVSVLPRGAVLGGLAAALFVAGLWRVDGVLAALGLALACLLALSRVLARLNVAGLELRLQCPEKVRAGAVFPLVLSLVNRRRWLDAFAVRIEVNLAGKTRTGGRAAWVSAGSAADLESRVSIPERTWVETQQVRLVSDFPFGVFEVVRTFEVAHPMCVFPKPIVPRGLAFSGGLMDAPHAEVAAAGETAGEIRGLRPWRAGDSPRRILWPASLRSMARGAGMVVRECDPPGFRPQRCAVVFHSFGGDGRLIRPDRFERALSLAAGALWHLQAQGMSARWMADFEDWTPRPATTRAQVAACAEAMARAMRAPGTEAHDLQAALAQIDDDEGLIVISDMPVSTWRSALPKRKQSAFLAEAQDSNKRREVLR